MLRWTVSDGRVRSMGIKPPVRQGNMLGGNVGLFSSQEYSRGYPLSSVALLLCGCGVMTGKMAQAESGNVSRKPDLGVIECITIVTASPKRWRSKWRKGVTVNAISPGYIGTKMVMAIPKDVLDANSPSDPARPPGKAGGDRGPHHLPLLG
jgi:hypothetical protein